VSRGDRLLAGLTAAAVAGGLAAGWWAARPDGAPVTPEPAGEWAVPQAAVLDDDEPVVGVSVGGRHRAYPLAELWLPGSHVLNDTVGLAPVTVTYCNLEDCARAFTADRRDGRPLDVENGGPNPLRARAMLLTVGDARYDQKTGQPVRGDRKPFPYPELATERTTWGRWRAAHPDTDAWVRGQVVGPSPASP
jgi:hypothetical protein